MIGPGEQRSEHVDLAHAAHLQRKDVLDNTSLLLEELWSPDHDVRALPDALPAPLVEGVAHLHERLAERGGRHAGHDCLPAFGQLEDVAGILPLHLAHEHVIPGARRVVHVGLRVVARVRRRHGAPPALGPAAHAAARAAAESAAHPAAEPARHPASLEAAPAAARARLVGELLHPLLAIGEAELLELGQDLRALHRVAPEHDHRFEEQTLYHPEHSQGSVRPHDVAQEVQALLREAWHVEVVRQER
mmetsp:Transcript_23100/g.65698  ORF Transcript_23100/g.65698 Transcript_23100/m.65698 type:complete len:247 (-) Transcript_23100:556-1296(-)